jgi:hypothetical protein
MNLGIIESYIKEQPTDYLEGLNLLAHYKLDNATGNAIDEKGNYPATDYDVVRNVNAKVGKGYDLIQTQPGTDPEFTSYFETIPSDVFISDNVFSFCGWFKPSLIESGNYAQRALTIFKGSSSSTLILGFDNVNKIFYFNGSARSEVGTANENEWYHLALTYDGTDARIYVNGFLSITVTHSLSTAINKKIQVGRFYTGFIGIVDEVKFSKTCWSAEDVNNIYINE